MRRYARKRDNNEQAIVTELEAYGVAVDRLSGDGQPDLLVSWRGEIYLLEVKDLDEHGKRTNKPHRARANRLDGYLSALTPAQQEWWSRWKGKVPVIVTTPYEALRAIGVVS